MVAISKEALQVIKKEKGKKGDFGGISLLVLFFGSVLIVSAAVLNSTDNSSYNTPFDSTLLNLSFLNESIMDNSAIENISGIENVTLLNETLNLTVPIENITTINETPIKKIKNLSDIVKKNENKLNAETEEYLKNINGKKEERNYLVKFRSSIDENRLVNVTLEKKIDKFKVTEIKGKAEDIGNLIEDDEIEFIELEQDVKVLGDNTPFNIKKVRADSAWNSSKGYGVKVAVLDTGIALHDDLTIAGGVSFVDNNYYDSNGHGTAVAGVIASLLNDEGLAGTAPSVDLYSVKIMQGSTGDLSNAIAGIEWVIDNNINIVSMSFGFDYYSQIFKEVLEEAYANNILLIAASGNEGTDNILYPAKYDTVIAVGATTSDDNLAYFSSYGFEQELVAPGVDINSTSLGNSYGLSSGTSLAAPHVAGVAALIKAYNSSLTNEQIRAKLRNDALDLGAAGKDDYFGYGLVQVDLETTNFTFVNESYFYEVFNITDYGLPNQTLWFWLNGTGTVDDVDFMPGYYLVNITYDNYAKKSYFYNILENGSIFILSTAVIHTDFFNSDGGSFTDNIAWVNDNVTVKATTTVPTPEGECYFIDGSSMLNYCYFDSDIHRDECDSDPEMNCNVDTICNINNLIGLDHEILNYASARTGSSKVRVWDDCTYAGSIEQNGPISYYIIDKKAARCINDSAYNVSGWYGTNWIKIAQSTCGSGYKCINSSNFTTESAYINPCIAENTCTGTVQVITEDRNGNPMPNLLVSRDLVSNKTTDSQGVAEYSLSKTCYDNMEFKVYCSNSSSATLCGTKTAKLDVVNDYEGLLFDCSICSGFPDMQIDVDNVKVNKATSNVSVNISLAGSVSAANINITFKVQRKDGLISREASQLFDISGGSFKALNQTIAINENDDFLHVYIDTNSKVTESNEKNNYALVPLFEKQIKVYFDINTSYTSVNNEIKDYIKLFVNEENNQNNADVILCVGKKCSNFNSLNSFTLNSAFKTQQKFGYKNNKIIFEGKDVGTNKPYNGVVGGFWNDLNGKKYIMAYGIDIDGDIAAVKKLISAKDLFFNPDLLMQDRTKIIDDYDLTGIAVADLLRNPSNFPYYNQRNSEAFANVVERILNNNNFEIAIKTVQTLNTTSYSQKSTLRLKNVNSDFSQNYKEVITSGSKPIVMSGGIFSTLTTWEANGNGLARDLVNEGHDVWEIELNGGENIECSTCPDYTYQDQVDYFWPALVAGVMNYSGKSQVHYIGHSNGCRVALSSLNSYSGGKNGAGYAFDSVTGLYDININLPNMPVDRFFGVACPATLNDGTVYTMLARSKFPLTNINKGDLSIDINRNVLNKKHLSWDDYARFLVPSNNALEAYLLSLFIDSNKLSINLMDFYNDLAINESSTFDISSINVNKLYLHNGFQSDLIVHFNDQTRLLNNATLNIQDEEGMLYSSLAHLENHVSIKNNPNLKEDIRGRLRE